MLGLAPDADERSIKRAYARLLKVHRPDENPDEFQRLRQAYEATLAEAQWRAQADDEGAYASLAVEPTPDLSPIARAPTLAIPLDDIDVPTPISPPEPSRRGSESQARSSAPSRMIRGGRFLLCVAARQLSAP